MNSRLVVYPFKELEICVYTEGAAALILAEEETARAISRSNGSPIIWITGLGESNEHSYAGKNQKIMSRIMSDHYASHRAYEMAGIADPTKSIEVVELHDAFVHQLEISMAEFGLVPLGNADSLIEDGLMTPGGKYLVNRLRRLDLLRACSGSKQHHVRVVGTKRTDRQKASHGPCPRDRQHHSSIYLLPDP